MAQRALELKTCGCSCGMHKYNANIISNYKVAVNRNTVKIFFNCTYSQPENTKVLQNNIALKQEMDNTVDTFGFGVIQNNIALKLRIKASSLVNCFGVIQNNIALKLFNRIIFSFGGFGVIQNNIALKRPPRIYTK